MINLSSKPVKKHRLVFFGYCVLLGCLANLSAVALPITAPFTVGNVAIFVILARLGPVWGLISFALVTLPLSQSPALVLSATQTLLFLWYYRTTTRSIWQFSFIYAVLSVVICYLSLPAAISNEPLFLALFVLLCTAVFAWCTKAAALLLAMSVSASQLRKQSLKNQLSFRFGLYAAIPATLLITLGLNGATSVNLIKKMAVYHFELDELKSDVELKLNEYVSVVQAIAALPQTNLDKSSLEHLVSQRPEFISALTTDNLGVVTQFYKADVTNHELLGASVADRAYFQAVTAYKQPYVSDTFTGRVLGQDQLFAVSAPLSDTDTFSGILQVSIKLDALLNVFRIDGTDNSHQLLLDSAGKKVWGNTISGSVGEPWVWPEQARPMLATFLKNSVFNPLTPIVISEDGHHLILQKKIGATGWTLNYFIDTDNAILLFYFYFALSLGMITLILEASVNLSKRFVSHYTKALEQLVEFTQLWDGKTTSQGKPEFSQSALEIDTLTESFINMQRRVSGAHHAIVATMQEVRQLNSELEQRVEQRTHELEEERDKATHLAAVKTRFLANMSHELRTPITIIKGFTETLLSQHDSQTMPLLTRIQQNTEHLHNVVNDILDVAKMDAGKMSYAPKSVNARVMLEDITSSLIQLCLNKPLTPRVATDVSAELCIWADPFRLKQILLNLISNAVKFTHNGHIDLAAHLEGENLLIRVADEGVGIAAEKVPTLFQAFTQADSSISRDYGGTGLGLYISKELSDAMGMQLSVNSELNKGSTFTLFIPAKLLSFDEQANSNTPKATPVFSEFSAVGKRVLVVDDVKDIRELIASFLKETGLILEFANDGREAVERVQHQTFDAILMDQQMPRLDGRSAAELIRQLGKNAPIVLLSADVFTDQTELAPFNDSLTKPIDRTALLSALSRQLNRQVVARPNEHDSDELFQEYLQSLTAQADKLEHLLDIHQTEQLKQELHKVKGTSACFGLQAISDAAAAVEQCLKQQAPLANSLAKLVLLMRQTQ
ncbi:MAG: response regulator [Gammaproteobacteria bacterium]|nr:response regulator [Gammaproteobacteria bacterium]